MTRPNSASGIAKAVPTAGLALVLGSTPAAAGTTSVADQPVTASAPRNDVAAPEPASPMLWVEDGPDRVFEPVAQTEETWLEELNDHERELSRELREARRSEAIASQEPLREEAPGLIWV